MRWGREEKGKIYQPQPSLTFIVGFNLGGWGGAREEKGRNYQPQPLLTFIIGKHNRYSTS